MKDIFAMRQSNTRASLSRSHLPSWLTVLYAGFVIALVPWIMYLSAVLPLRQVVHNWNLVWIGFDIMILVTAIITSYFAVHRSPWIALSTSILSTLLIIDAWFDIATARPFEAPAAWLLAIFFEIPLALISGAVAIGVFRVLLRRADS